MAEYIDPFEGTPQEATKTQYGVNGSTKLKRAKRAQKFEVNGLWGLKDLDGTILYEPENIFIGVCRDHVLRIKPDWRFIEESKGCTTSGYLPEEERPYVVNGKAGIMIDGEVIIPAEYDYIKRKFGGNVFYAVKDGREMYIDDKAKEVLTRVRTFERESNDYSPFWLCSDAFDIITTMNYMGQKDSKNPNVVMINGEWIELERYCKDEIMDMLINPDDDLPITERDLKMLCNKFSYEYSFYFAKATGKHAMRECVEQFKKMRVFSNSWYYVVKIWQAEDEFVTAKELRLFTRSIREKALKSGLIGVPVYAIGHSKDLKRGDVRVLLITHYNEHCFPPLFEFEWFDKCRTLPVTMLLDEMAWLRESIDNQILDPFKEEVFNDLIKGCIRDHEYYDGLVWDDVEKALESFRGLGSPVTWSMHKFLKKASNHIKRAKTPNYNLIQFYLKSAKWALQAGDTVNMHDGKRSSLDLLLSIKSRCTDADTIRLLSTLEELMLSSGAKTYAELEKERNENTDYFQELEYLNAESALD